MMKQLLRSKALWVCVVLAGAGAWAASQVYTAHQFKEAKAMSEDMFKPDTPQPVCFGRMVFDLPKGAKQQGSLYQYQGAYLKIEETPNVTQTGFDRTVGDFEEQLRTTKHEKDPSLLRSVRMLKGPGGGKIFVHWDKEFSEHVMTLTGFSFLNGVQYKLISNVSLNQIQEVTHEMAYALEHLRPKAPHEVPAEHGFCLNTAVIPDDLKGEGFEEAKISFDVPPWEFVNIDIVTGVNYVKPTDTLLERPAMAAKRFPLFSKGITTLRSGKRRVGDLDGEELLMHLTENERTYFLFMWEVQGAIKSNNPPDIHLELRVGQDGKPGEMTKVQALALWEYLLPRLRVRPVTDQAAKVSAAPALTPLGELAATGRICPQTGWWQCSEEALPVKGGRKQLVRQGEPLPQVTLLGEPSMLDRLKGRHPEYSTATVWKLVEYEHPVETGTNEHPKPGALADSADAQHGDKGEAGDDAPRDQSA